MGDEQDPAVGRRKRNLPGKQHPPVDPLGRTRSAKRMRIETLAQKADALEQEAFALELEEQKAARRKACWIQRAPRKQLATHCMHQHDDDEWYLPSGKPGPRQISHMAMCDAMDNDPDRRRGIAWRLPPLQWSAPGAAVGKAKQECKQCVHGQHDNA